MSSEQMERELLELAAKAAGIRLHVWGTKGEENFADLDTHARWNPLTDDGDALRLAVKLGLLIDIGREGRGFVAVRSCDHNWMEIRERGQDTDANVRRAITRAAAQLAKGAEK